MLFIVGKLQYIGNPYEFEPDYRVTPKLGTRGLRRIQVTGDSDYRQREMKKRENDEHPVVYSFDEVSSVVEEDNSPPSGPASAPSGTPPFVVVVVSPTW